MNGCRKNFIIEIFVKVSRYFQAIFKRDNKKVHFILLIKVKPNSYINSVIIVFVCKKKRTNISQIERNCVSYNQQECHYLLTNCNFQFCIFNYIKRFSLVQVTINQDLSVMGERLNIIKSIFPPVSSFIKRQNYLTITVNLW